MAVPKHKRMLGISIMLRQPERYQPDESVVLLHLNIVCKKEFFMSQAARPESSWVLKD